MKLYLDPITVTSLTVLVDKHGALYIDHAINFDAFDAARRSAVKLSEGNFGFARVMLKHFDPKAGAGQKVDLYFQPVDRDLTDVLIPDSRYSTPNRAAIAILKEDVSKEPNFKGLHYLIGGLYSFVLNGQAPQISTWLSEKSRQIRFRAQPIQEYAVRRRKRRWLVGFSPLVCANAATTPEVRHA